MKWIYDLKVAHKLAVAFGVCLTLAIVAGLVAVARMGDMERNTKSLATNALTGSSTAGTILSDMKQFRIYQIKMIMAETPVDIENMRSMMAERSTKIERDFDAYAANSVEAEDRANLDRLKQDWTAYRALDGKTAAIARANDLKADLAFVNGESYKAFSASETDADRIAEWNVAHGASLGQHAEQAFSAGRTVVLGLIALATVLGILFAIFVTRMITDALAAVNQRIKSLDDICINNLNRSVQAMASGDLTVPIPTGTTLIERYHEDEFGTLAKSVNGIILKTQATVHAYETAQKSLARLVGQTRSASDSIHSTSEEIANGNEDLSHRTSEQASSLEETAASMEEMTSIVKQSAYNAREANRQAAEARQVAEQGGAIVHDAVEAMQQINAASRQISDIVSVIDEIAFQTNLLALNAAVEAARVGEQGRGFAVVASEVRNLAGRSSTAAKEIKALVQDTVRKVEDGTELVNKSGEQLTEIVSAVNRVADIVSDIAAAAQEQASGIEQVNKAVLQMDEITQQNAALVEEASAASQSMAQQAEDLQALVRRFKVSDEDRRPISAPSPGLPQRPLFRPKGSASAVSSVPRGATRQANVLTLVTQTNEDIEEF